ncbi:MAG: DUF1849 family protein [Rhodospirillaceae bacterium]|nr:DUF1849 family protein [Rhodospirillaceae bacterium]
MLWKFLGRIRRVGLLLVPSVAGFLVADLTPAAADLLPHRVVYTLTLGSSGAVGRGDGLMSFEVKDVCDGWAMDLKAELNLATEDGEVHRLGWSQVSWEAKDGTRYRYFSRELTDTEETARRRGEARRESIDAPATVTADLPQKAEFELPAGVMFPLQHTIALIEADAAGKPYLLVNLFDGSIGDHAVELGAALSRGGKDWTQPGKDVPELRGLHSFPVALAFYMGESPEGLPDTEQRMRLYENGVVGQLDFAFGDINVQARIDDFKALPPEDC